MATSWFLVQLKPNARAVAERNLLRQEFEVFFPTEEITKRQNAKFIKRTQLLFPGYGFVGFDLRDSRWRAINSTLGVARLVSFARDPAQVPSQLVAGLMRRYGAGTTSTEVGIFKPGDKVSITSGPFADFTATIDKVEPNRRVYVLMDLMGKDTKVALDPRQLRSA